jgi:hypothetical protein
MRKLIVITAMAATALGGSAATAQLVDPATSRDIGRAVGEAAVAAERAAAEATIAAREAMRAARQGYAEAGGRYARRAAIVSEDEAVDACALAAEQRGYDDGFRTVVRDISGVDRTPDGWNVDGIVEARRGWRDRPASSGFHCAVRGGQIVSVDIGGDFARR